VRLQKSVGRAIRMQRERLGLTQAVLAEAVGLTEQYIGVIERGVRAPSFRTLEALARTLQFICASRNSCIVRTTYICILLVSQYIYVYRLEAEVLSCHMRHSGVSSLAVARNADS